MKIPCETLLYETRKVFSHARLIEGYKLHGKEVEGLMFWSSAEKMRGHLVLIDEHDIKHIVHHHAQTLFVLAAPEAPEGLPAGNAGVVLGEAVDVRVAFNRLSELLDMLNVWEADLKRAVGEYFSFEAIVHSCDSILSVPLALMDDEFHYVSYSKQLANENGYEDLFVDSNGYLPLEYINAATSATRYKESLAERDVYRMAYLENGLHKNVFCDGRFIGRLTLPYSDDEVENAFSAFVLRTVARYVERLYANVGTFYRLRANDTRLQAALSSLLGGGDVGRAELGRLLENRGYRLGDTYYLVQFKSVADAATSRLGDSLGTYLSASWPGCFGFTFGDKTLMLANATYFARSARREFASAMAYFLRESLLVAGLSRAFSDVADARAALAQTDIALTCGEMLDPTQWFPKFEDYAFWHLLHHGTDGFAPHQICDPAIFALRDYDRAHATQLELTLKTFIWQRYNAVAAARKLHLSRSAFLKRLARIEKIASVNFDDVQRRFYLASSFAVCEQDEQLRVV